MAVLPIFGYFNAKTCTKRLAYNTDGAAAKRFGDFPRISGIFSGYAWAWSGSSKTWPTLSLSKSLYRLMEA
jgi:hypothetical protein